MIIFQEVNLVLTVHNYIVHKTDYCVFNSSCTLLNICLTRSPHGLLAKLKEITGLGIDPFTVEWSVQTQFGNGRTAECNSLSSYAY